MTADHHCALLVLSRWMEISFLELGAGSRVQVDSEGWISWGRGPWVLWRGFSGGGFGGGGEEWDLRR